MSGALRVTDQGLVEYIYTLKILNKHDSAHRFRVEVEGLPGVFVDADSEQEVASGSVADITARVRIDPVDLTRPSTRILFRVTALDDETISNEDEARFLKPR